MAHYMIIIYHITKYHISHLLAFPDFHTVEKKKRPRRRLHPRASGQARATAQRAPREHGGQRFGSFGAAADTGVVSVNLSSLRKQKLRKT